MNSDQLKGRIVAADVKGERLLVTIQLDKIEPVGVGARVQIVHHGMRADVEKLVTACQVYLAGSTAKPKADQRIDILKAVAHVDDHLQ